MEKVRILVADDDPEIASAIKEYLGEEGYNIRSVSDGEAAFRAVQSWNPHLCILDVNMPKLTGLECLKKIRAERFNEYVVVILNTANSSLEEITEGLDLGANDYIVKPFRVEELRARVRAGLRIKALYDSLARANKRLAEAATLDELTGLRNMRFMARKLEEEIAKAKRLKNPLSCVMMDMDHFKNVNDKHDHLFGSYVLSEIGKILKSVVRSSDIAARFGGDEFFLLLPNTNIEQATLIANQIRKRLEAHYFSSGNHSTQLTVSIGVCGVQKPEEILEISGNELMRVADAALYDAKNTGRNRVVVRDYKS